MSAHDTCDVIIVGAGAAGLMTAIWAGRTYPDKSITLLDGAKKLGAKILVAGGGRCNVTHYTVDAERYAGSSTKAIGKVLRRFDVPETTAFFSDLGVQLKREDTGKLFPTTDAASDVLEALLKAVADAGVSLQHPKRVESIEKTVAGFTVAGTWGWMHCKQLVLATGGMSLPKSGSDGQGFSFARTLGHQVNRTFPALVPLILSDQDPIRTLSGITLPATLRLHSSSGKRLIAYTNSTLCTHFGLSGPSVLDISRHLIDLQETDPMAYLTINWAPNIDATDVDTGLQRLGKGSIRKYLHVLGLPERLVLMLLDQSGLSADSRGDQLSRPSRRTLVQTLTEMRLDVTGNRGYKFAEVTAGGVPLAEIDLKSMASRVCEGLYLCGEICDVDGPIGGLNFQWAWSSGYLAGISVGS